MVAIIFSQSPNIAIMVLVLSIVITLYCEQVLRSKLTYHNFIRQSYIMYSNNTVTVNTQHSAPIKRAVYISDEHSKA